jgi:flagellin
MDATYDHTKKTVQGDVKTQNTAAAAQFQVSSSAHYGTDDLISVSVGDLRVSSLGLASIDLSNNDPTAPNAAQAALTALDGAIGKVNDALGAIGAAQSRFDFAATNVAAMVENTQAAESTIRDADMAYEMTQFSKNNILQQAAQSMLSQANQGSQGILQLLRG